MQADCLILVSPFSEAEGSSEALKLVNALRECGIEAKPRAHKPSEYFCRWRTAPGAVFATGIVGEIVIPLTQALGPPFFTFLGAWLTARYGRKVRVKFGDVEAEAATVADVDALLQRAKKFYEEKSPDGKGGSS